MSERQPVSTPCLHPDSLAQLHRRAVREVALLHAASAALALAPNLDERACALERAGDALSALEVTSELFGELAGMDLLRELERARAVPVPDTWVCACVAAWVMSLAEVAELLEEPSGRDDARGLARARERMSAARAALDEACCASPSVQLEVRRALRIWVPLARASVPGEAARRRVEETLAREWSRPPALRPRGAPQRLRARSRPTARLHTVSGR